MPVLAVALPSLQFGFNRVTFARRMALYFVVPLGLAANAVGYSNHRNLAVTSTSLLGVSCVTAAATVKRLAPRRNWLNAFGCVLMLASSYKGRQLERQQAAQAQAQGKKGGGTCCDCCDNCSEGSSEGSEGA